MLSYCIDYEDCDVEKEFSTRIIWCMVFFNPNWNWHEKGRHFALNEGLTWTEIKHGFQSSYIIIFRISSKVEVLNIYSA